MGPREFYQRTGGMQVERFTLQPTDTYIIPASQDRYFLGLISTSSLTRMRPLDSTGAVFDTIQATANTLTKFQHALDGALVNLAWVVSATVIDEWFFTLLQGFYPSTVREYTVQEHREHGSVAQTPQPVDRRDLRSSSPTQPSASAATYLSPVRRRRQF